MRGVHFHPWSGLLVAVVVLSMIVGVGGVATAIAQEQEPNDDFGFAQPISEGNVTAEVVDGESDFYRIEVNTTDALDVRVSPDSDGLAFRIYAPNQTELVSDGFVNEGGTDRLTVKAPTNGTYYIEVVGGGSTTTANYTLDVNRVTPEENDPFAPNDDFGSAAAITREIIDAKLWGRESDFYRVSLNASEGLRISIRPDSDGTAFHIYAPNRTELASDGFVNEGSTDRLTISAPKTGTYYVEVEGKRTQRTTVYRLRSNRTTPAPDCGPPGIAGNPRPTDADGNGLCEDVNGDETVNILDVAILLDNLSSPAVTNNPSNFDFKPDGTLNILDVAALLAET